MACKLNTSVSFQALSKVLFTINLILKLSYKTPTHTTEINWVHKLGYYLITIEKEKADDWVIILDHSIQIGTEKIFLVYGIREKDIDFTRPLMLKDLTPLIIEVKEKWDGLEVSKVLSKLNTKIGNIKYAVGDYGSNIKKGLELCGIDHIHDLTHKIALILEKIYKNNDQYQKLTKMMSIMRKKHYQSKYSIVIPPKQKSKSRYQNIGIISDWGKNVINLLEKLSSDKTNEIYNKVAWVLEFKELIDELYTINQIVKNIEKLIKHNGFSKSTIKKCYTYFKNITLTVRHKIFKQKIKIYLESIKKYFQNATKLLGSSDIIESAFGKYKNYVSNNPMAGVTNLILTLAAFTSDLQTEEIENAMVSTPIRLIKDWTKENLGESLLSKRRKLFCCT